jgi:hypothetical protein
MLDRILGNNEIKDAQGLVRSFGEALVNQLYATCENKDDDTGKPYIAEGKLLPNNTYILGGIEYTTDDQGNIISFKGVVNQKTPDNPRNEDAQKSVGGDDRKPGDQGGHIIPRILGGDGDIGNLIPLDARINLSDYSRMEKDILKKVGDGQPGNPVQIDAKLTYPADSSRPDKITVTTVDVNGETTVYTFDNNIDGSLAEGLSPEGQQRVQDVIDEKGGQVSSTKEVYDSEGNLIASTATITYTDANGENKRITVNLGPL